jgi:hypothetical protein
MFALFSTQEGPSLARYSIYSLIFENVDQHDMHIYTVELVQTISVLSIEASTIEPKPTIIRINKDGTIIPTCYWPTTWNVVIQGNIIPVYDFLHSNLIFNDSIKREAVGDTVGWCEYRIFEQTSIYRRMIAHINLNPAQFPSWILIPPPSKATALQKKGIPKFVAEALVKACMDDDCSISMKPFKECESVGVTNCFHCFESDSITTWYKTKNSCPICKTMIESIVMI